MVARFAVNEKVVGSNPTAGAEKLKSSQKTAQSGFLCLADYGEI